MSRFHRRLMPCSQASKCFMTSLVASLTSSSPCSITPVFNSKRVTLRKLVVIIDVVEESRLKDRMAVVHERSHGGDEHVDHSEYNFPRLVLSNVLDIIHVERMDNIWAQFEETLSAKSMYFHSMCVTQDETLKAMSLVHQSWTAPVQEALGWVLYIGKLVDDHPPISCVQVDLWALGGCRCHTIFLSRCKGWIFPVPRVWMETLRLVRNPALYSSGFHKSQKCLDQILYLALHQLV